MEGIVEVAARKKGTLRNETQRPASNGEVKR
jgi:hypothetical protein